MSNRFFVDVSSDRVDKVVSLDVSERFNSNTLSYSYETIVKARENFDDFNVFNRNSKTIYDSKIIRGIHIQGMVWTNSRFAQFGTFYVILYKTILGENNKIKAIHPADDVGTLSQWFLYSEPEIVLTYKTYKIIDNQNFFDQKRSVRIDVSYNKPVLFRPNDIIIVEYALLTWTDNGEFTDGNFTVDATAKVRFDSV